MLAFCVSVVRGDEPKSPWIELELKKGDIWETCNFGGDGEIEFSKEQAVLEFGDPLTGIRLVKPFPKDEFEVQFEANRLDGFDFFVGLTFPVADSHCSLILGGWAGSVVGLSNIDGYDASDNPTTVIDDFENDKWHKIRLIVQNNRIAAWVNDKKLVDHPRDGFKFDIRPEMDASTPFGISAFQCKVAYRNIRYRKLSATSDAKVPQATNE